MKNLSTLSYNARVMKLANILDSKSSAARLAGSSPAPGTLAYIVGIAIGDGNLTNANGRAQRLRISCDTKYPNLIRTICSKIQEILPDNKISFIKKGRNCIDISCYSNQWEKWLGWKCKGGSKLIQRVSVPKWIMSDKFYTTECLRGLFQTDGSIYRDRDYIMVNFVTVISELAYDVISMVKSLGFRSHLYITDKDKSMKHIKYTIRISKNAEQFIKYIDLVKN